MIQNSCSFLRSRLREARRRFPSQHDAVEPGCDRSGGKWHMAGGLWQAILFSLGPPGSQLSQALGSAGGDSCSRPE